MNRSDLIDQLAARFSQLTQGDAELAVTAILDSMSDALASGRRIEVRGFGVLTVRQLAPKLGRNPRSGEPVNIPGRRVTHFKPGKGLRDAVDQQVHTEN
jgi:integration host factor subunit beta